MPADMNLRTFPWPALFAVVLGSVLLPVAAPAAPENAPGAKPAAAPAAPDAGLKQGAPAAEVRKLLGEPAEIRAMKAPNGKAEVWIYSHEISHSVDQVAIGSQDVVTSVTDATGHSHTVTMPGEPRFQTVHRIVQEITEVLMFNDNFVTRKVTRQQRQTFN